MTRAPQSESMEQRTHRILQSPFCHSAFRSERQEISIIAWPLATLLGGSALLRSLWKAYLLRFAFSSPGEAVFNRSAVSFIGALLIFVIPFAETFAHNRIGKRNGKRVNWPSASASRSVYLSSIVLHLSGLGVGDESEDVPLLRIDIAMFALIPFGSIDDFRKNQLGFNRFQCLRFVEHIVNRIGAPANDVR